MGVMEIFVGCA